MLNATNVTGAYTRKIASIKAQSIVEIKFTEQDLGEAVVVSPQVSLGSAEVVSGRVIYGGRLICTVVCADGERLIRVQKGAEFSHKAESELFAPSQTCTCALECERTQVMRDGSGFTVSVVVSAKIETFDRAERSYISSLEGAIARTEEGKLFNAVHFSGESDVDDDFSVVATDILVPSAKAAVLECSVKTGSIEIGGEIYISLLAVREGAPVAAERIVPFKAELPCEQAQLSFSAFCRAEVKDISVNCKVNEERGKCDVNFSATLGFSGTFFEEENAVAVTDAFSAEKELKLTFFEEENAVWKDVKVYSERVFGVCATKAKLDYTCSLLAAALPGAEFARTQEGIEGAVFATLLYSQSGEIHSTGVELPFSVKLSGLNPGCTNLTVAVMGVSIRQRAEGECEAEAVLKISAADVENSSVRYLVSAEEGDDKPVCNSAISVCIPSAGDGLWQTAKKLNASPEEVQKCNPQLKFPLSGDERVLIFRAKS